MCTFKYVSFVFISSSFVYFRAIIGLIDEDLDNQLNLASIKAEPLNAIVH